ncbi:MAG: response regulator [Ideonella sp.]
MANKENREDRICVLYVEDEPVNVLMMRALFDYRPMLKLVVATTGRESIDLVATLSPALLLLDLHLPDCHGAELLKQLRQVASCREVPAIAVTSDKAFESRGSGFCEVWHKPFLLFHTLDRIDKRLLGRRGQATPNRRVMLSTA